DLARRMVAATRVVRAAVAATEGLRVQGDPSGPLLAVVADGTDPVHPHLWAAAVARHGFVLQGQPALTQADGTVLPRSTHLTITPATAGVLDDLVAALRAGAEEARG